MSPDYSSILICPVCSHKKEVLSLCSGNFIGARFWSDNKIDAPMMPFVSPVQKCPNCENYYFKSRAQSMEKSDQYSFELGILNFEDCQKSILQFENESLSKHEEMKLRELVIHAYNDKYYRTISEEDESLSKTPKPEDWTYFVENTERLLLLLEDEEYTLLFQAELLREIGKFDESVSLLHKIESEDREIAERIYQIKKKALANDNRVFEFGYPSK
ncbi:MAG: hypothetical protein ACRCSR_07605 [Bacteroidales bacterium]